MAVTDSHDTTPPPSYEEVQLKDKGKDGKDDNAEEKKEGEEKKTEEEIPPVGLFELV